MVELEQSRISPDLGVEGDYRGRAKPDGRINRRQISVLRREDWELACDQLGVMLHWTMRRANLLIEGLELPQRAGTMLAFGEHVRLQVTCECDPCKRMDEQKLGLWPALVPDWRGGYLTRVVAGGTIRLGDTVRIDEQ